MKLSINTNAAKIAARLNDIAKSQLPYATARALNDTADQGKKAIAEHMTEVFDEPTRFTLNAYFIWYAKKSTLVAAIRRKTMVAGRHYLAVQGRGGGRPATGFESFLRGQVKYAGGLKVAVPTSKAKRDRHGNLSRGQRTQIVRGLTSQKNRGAVVSTTASRSRRQASYFATGRGSHLSPGVYRRERDNSLSKVISFGQSVPHYERRFKPAQVVRRVVVNEYAKNFRQRLTQAIKTAR